MIKMDLEMKLQTKHPSTTPKYRLFEADHVHGRTIEMKKRVLDFGPATMSSHQRNSRCPTGIATSSFRRCFLARGSTDTVAQS